MQVLSSLILSPLLLIVSLLGITIADDTITGDTLPLCTVPDRSDASQIPSWAQIDTSVDAINLGEPMEDNTFYDGDAKENYFLSCKDQALNVGIKLQNSTVPRLHLFEVTFEKQVSPYTNHPPLDTLFVYLKDNQACFDQQDGTPVDNVATVTNVTVYTLTWKEQAASTSDYDEER